jgi:hypothetical protein
MDLRDLRVAGSVFSDEAILDVGLTPRATGNAGKIISAPAVFAATW